MENNGWKKSLSARFMKLVSLFIEGVRNTHFSRRFLHFFFFLFPSPRPMMQSQVHPEPQISPSLVTATRKNHLITTPPLSPRGPL